MNEGMRESDGEQASRSRPERWVAAVLILCVGSVIFWEIMSARSRCPFESFQITPDDFDGFVPTGKGWQVTRLPVRFSAIEPNILAFRVRPTVPQADAALVRLVHGYNMPDCMRIKGYTVKLDTDTRAQLSGAPSEEPVGGPVGYQLWRLTSATGEQTLWATCMLSAGTFRETGSDVRCMAFPRIGVPDDPRWMPEGFTWRSLRHPIRNARWALRAKWNKSRADMATFLGLKQPAWASDELLVLVTAIGRSPDGEADGKDITDSLIAAQAFMYGELIRWRGDNPP